MNYKEKIIALLNSQELSKEQKEKLECIFPELKESESEQIRKELIAEVKEQIDCIPAPDCRDEEDEKALKQLNKWLAWLEKQGEKKSLVIPKFRAGDTIKNKKTNKIFTISDYSLLYEYYHDINHYHEIKFSEQDDWELVEQNPALGEEDETKIKSIIALLKSPSLCAMDGNKGIIDENIKYLKSLKERIIPQPKQEWSEEDEEALLRLTSFVEDWDKLAKGEKLLRDCTLWSSDENLAERLLNFLKSLKDRYAWRPSDEQMDALRYVTNFDYGGYKATLVSLYEQLKKLRGE